MQKREILVAFGLDGRAALGNVWRITAKKTDFYLEPVGAAGGVHLSAHGPNHRFPEGHRFHVKVPQSSAAAARREGHLVLHGLPAHGWALDGHAVGPGAFRVARIRWTWDLQRPRYRAAAYSGPAPTIGEHQSGAALIKALLPNEAADVDIVVSYGEPFWPNADGSLRDNARLGPLRNEAGMWLTATNYRRSQMSYPAPEQVGVPRPGRVMSPSASCAEGRTRPLVRTGSSRRSRRVRPIEDAR